MSTVTISRATNRQRSRIEVAARRLTRASRDVEALQAKLREARREQRAAADALHTLNEEPKA